MQRASMSVDRVVVATALLLLAVCGWWYLAAWPMPMPGGEGALTMSYLSLTAVMWLLMMIAMMTPSVAPVVMLFSRVSRQTDAPLLRTASFMSGYFSAWVAFSVVVALLQVLLLQQRWIDAMGITRSRAFSAALLVAVGVISGCRSNPLALRIAARQYSFSLITIVQGSAAPGAWAWSTACTVSAAVGCSCCCCSSAA